MSCTHLPKTAKPCLVLYAKFHFLCTYLLTCTCVGIHPGRVEPASPTALTTSRTEALQAWRSCASSLDTFTQSFLHRAWPKTRGPEIGSRSALIVVAKAVARCVVRVMVAFISDVSRVISTPRAPVPASLHLEALQLKPI